MSNQTSLLRAAAMMKRAYRSWAAVLGLALMTALTACQSMGKEPTFGADLTGIDHLADHLSVSNFSVNGTGGFQAGKGGSNVCCAVLPEKWHPGLTAHVKWDVSDWKHGGGRSYEADVPVDQYAKVGHLWVHFLANGSVRIVMSDIGPYAPDYPGPHDPIPRKQPWYMYPARIDHREWNERSADIALTKQRCATAADPAACAKQAREKSLDEQLVDARRYLPPCASMAGDIQECVRTAEAHMREARWARRCQTAPNLPECTAIKATPTVR
jgi:hypothetical protein